MDSEIDKLFIWVPEHLEYPDERWDRDNDWPAHIIDKTIALRIIDNLNYSAYEYWLDNNTAADEEFHKMVYPWLPPEEQGWSMAGKPIEERKFTGPWILRQYMCVGVHKTK